MIATHPGSRLEAPWLLLARGFAGFILALMMFVWLGAPAHAAPPPAGTSISNQASATYSDGSGVARTVTSNLVQTTVTQVYSLTLTAPGAQNATPGSVVYYPHTLTNTGNGTDTFNLSAANNASQAYSLNNIQIFLDNGSGAPTGAAITAPVSVASNGTFKFIVQGTVPASATSGQTNTITVTAASVGDATKTATNADVTTVTSNAVITLTKSISVASGPASSGPYTYTLTYTNTGNSDATNVAITDAIPAGMTYVSGSARWSVTGASTALSDAAAPGTVGTSPNTLSSSFNSGSFVATVARVTPGQSGYVTLRVNVNANVPPSVLPNTATVAYNNGTTTVNGTSNTVPFTVTQTAAVAIAGDTVATANAGATVTFINVVTNNGNGTDTFNVTFAPTNSFPLGTTFQLYKNDGTTPLVDTNGDGVLDTGPLASQGTYAVYVKATLPPSASGTGPFTIDKTARSVFDATKSATATDTLTTVVKASVDLAHTTTGTGAGTGAGTGPESGAVVTNSTNPGTTTVFTLVTRNTGPAPDTYNLTASTDSTFGTLSLPSGWTVTFKADASGGSCTTTGATITNTGSVANGGTATVCAVVTIPANYDAGTVQVYFRALSPNSTAVDALHDAVTINAVRSMSITPNGTGQTFPGGSYVYTHTLTNNGNVTEGSTFSTLTPSLVNNGSGWTSTFYYDTNNNGTLDAGDALVGATLNLGTGLAKGASITLFNKVIAPSGAVAGTVNATTITVTTTNPAGGYTTTVPTPTVATDSTTVIAGNLTLVKEQKLDTACAGNLATGTWTQGNLSAKPDECVLYRITVTNVGAADATNVVVSDATPSYTTISTVATTAAPGQVTGPAAGASGTISAYIGTGATATTGGTLAAGQSATVTFGVRITP